MGMFMKTAIYALTGVVLALGIFSLISSPPSAPPVQDGWYGKSKIRSEDDPTIRPFTINIPDEDLADLQTRLENTRYADQLEDSDFNYGFPSQYLKEIVGYWKDEYDWRKHEAILNSFPQFVTQIEGIDVHFIRVKPPSGVKAGRKPLIIIHGWPGSVWEFHKLIPRLTEPEKYGGRKEDAREVICPSIPGYGFSEKPHRKGFNQLAAARVFTKLMQRLGFEQFYVQGGDWGGLIAIMMAQVFPSNVVGLHANMFPIPLFEAKTIVHRLVLSVAPSIFLDEREQRSLARMGSIGSILAESGYMHIQATRPDTVGKGLNDSPAGLAAYILEKFSVWTDPDNLNYPDGKLTKKFTLDELLTNIMIYWTTGTITSSQRFYKEYFSGDGPMLLDKVPVTVPTGLADFPNELFSSPRQLLDYKYQNIIQYTTMPSGGHFAAFEEPELLANDILNFIRKLEGNK